MKRKNPNVLLAFVLLILSAGAGRVMAAPVISEVLYDAVGADNGNVFVELYGIPGTVLDGFTLIGINGVDGTPYLTASLSGMIPADGVFVVADANSGATTVPNADLLVANVDFQNGPDSIQLKDGDTVLDAVGYGDFAAAVFAGEGTPVAGVSAGTSIARGFANVDTGDNFADFIALAGPTPGTVDLAPVPLPGALLLFASALAVFAARGRVERRVQVNSCQRRASAALPSTPSFRYRLTAWLFIVEGDRPRRCAADL